MQGLIQSTEQRLKRLLFEALVNSETMIALYACETNWSEDQVASVRNEVRNTLYKGGA